MTTRAPAGPTWTEAPTRATAHGIRNKRWLAGATAPGPASSLLALAVASVGPPLRAVVLQGSSATLARQALLVQLIAGLVLVVSSDRLWFIRLAAIGGAGAVLFGGQGQLIAVWSMALLLVTDIGIRRRRIVPIMPTVQPGALVPVLLLCLWSTYLGIRQSATYEPLVPIGVALAICVLLMWPNPLGDRFGAFGLLLGRAIRWWLLTWTSTLVALVIVPLPWVLQRILRLDPLRPSEPGWKPLPRRDIRPTEGWMPEVTIPSRSPLTRIRGAIPGIVCLLVVASVLQSASQRYDRDELIRRLAEEMGLSAFRTDAPIPGAVADEPWYQQVRQDMNWAHQESVAWNLLDQYRFEDFETRYVNVRDGRRVSWEPPPSSRPRVTAWLYGGSTIFGWDQRDEHTIASELARAAHAEGIDLVVVNRGMNGQSHFLEANRFAWDLASDPQPDMVIFYDGWNELWAGRQLVTLGYGDRPQPLDPMIADLGIQIAEAAGPRPDPPNAGEVLAERTPRNGSPDLIGELTMLQYERSRHMSVSSARAHGIIARYFWQPTLASRTPIRSGDPRKDPVAEQNDRDQTFAALERLPDDVVDLTGVFDDVEVPIYTDDGHHGERGARIVAAAILDSIRPDLEGLLYEG